MEEGFSGVGDDQGLDWLGVDNGFTGGELML